MKSKIELHSKCRLDTVQMLKDHSKEVPAHRGYTKFEFSWREQVDSLENIDLTVENYGDYFIRFSYEEDNIIKKCSFNRKDVERYIIKED